jgi:hypothetical protein
MSRLTLSAEEQQLLLMANPLQKILRGGFRGRPFYLAGERLHTFRSNIRFEEALVLGLVDRGLLTVNQCARDLPDRANPGTTYDCPFACILSNAGLEQRAYLIADGGIRAANDAGGQERAA